MRPRTMKPLNREAFNRDPGAGPAPVPITVLTGFLGAGKTTVDFPNARHNYTDIEGPIPRNVEYDPKLYYPPDVYRKPNPIWPKNFKIDIKKMVRDRVVQKLKVVFGGDE
jgi:hypothetical protein